MGRAPNVEGPKCGRAFRPELRPPPQLYATPRIVGGPLGPKHPVSNDANTPPRSNTQEVRIRPARSRILRKGRHSEAGRIYFITSSCAGKISVFRDSLLASILIEETKHQEDKGDCNSLAFVAMPDHFHWLMQLAGKRTLQEIVGSLKGRSARRINLVRGISARVWQPGFHDHALRVEEDIENVANYLLLNPVRAGLVERFEEYPYWYSVWHDRG
jgi:putative transposase